MSTPLQTLGTFPGAYEAALAAGGWPDSSGHQDYAQLKPARQAEARAYHESFTLTLAYLATGQTSRIHSYTLRDGVQRANAALTFDIVETACISAALSTTGGFRGVPGTTQAYVTRDDGESVWEDVGGLWLSKP